jgi:hypothetical protein
MNKEHSIRLDNTDNKVKQEITDLLRNTIDIFRNLLFKIFQLITEDPEIADIQMTDLLTSLFANVLANVSFQIINAPQEFTIEKQQKILEFFHRNINEKSRQVYDLLYMENKKEKDRI